MHHSKMNNDTSQGEFVDNLWKLYKKYIIWITLSQLIIARRHLSLPALVSCQAEECAARPLISDIGDNPGDTGDMSPVTRHTTKI